MIHATPESIGLSSRDVLAFYRHLDAYGLSTHSVVLARGDRVFSECYYAPFHKDFKHRMYSVSKSFVSIAVGFCEQDGLLSLDDPMVKYLPEYLSDDANPHLRTVTIREMLTMESAVERGAVNWFTSGTSDRTETYFRKTARYKYPDTLFHYDSSGSYILGVIVERLTGKPFIEYLKDKALREIGFSEDAYCLKVPGGHSFGDSGVMCSTYDLMLFARFVLSGGTFDGVRYLNGDYVKKATTTSVSTNDYGFGLANAYGYGYQIWGAPRGCFAFNGMGTQVAVCDPKNDIVLAINSDNQGNASHYEHLHAAFFTNIIDKLSDAPLPENPEAYTALQEYVQNAKLFSLPPSESDFSEQINGKTFTCDKNPMGWKQFRFTFEDGKGTLYYENAQGEKSFPFGLGYNEFAKFPEENYADLVATVPVPGHRYDAAFSADWCEPQKLRIRVQIIDKYFGNLGIVFGFRDSDHASVRMTKTAEAFLEEYNGFLNASATNA